MKVAIIGFGVEGQVSARYWAGKGYDVVVCDCDSTLKVPKDYEGKLGDDYLAGLGNMDLIVRSPGIRPDEILGANPMFPGLARRMTTAVKEFMHECPAPIIGVTGTKGKGTTSTLITKMLEAAGKKVWLGGNIGRSPLEFLKYVEREDWVVLELSSFQLMDVDVSPRIGVCLMIVPEHMNWHKDMDEYTAAKGNIFRFQHPGDLAVFMAGNESVERLAELSPGRRVPYGKEPGAWVDRGRIMMEGVEVCKTDDVALVGPHNLENVCAAVTAVWELVGRDAAVVRKVAREFEGLPHRLELVAEVDGTRYYDDSFATTPETAMAAVASFKEPKVMILGGSDKGAKFGELARAVAGARVRRVVLVGETADTLKAALARAGFKGEVVTGLTTMPAMVDACRDGARTGDVVLLSPGCASFGLFRDYKDRGEQFAAAVQGLGPQKVARRRKGSVAEAGSDSGFGG